MNRGWGVEGCWHIWGWIIVSFQTCTICMLGSGLEPLHSSHTELLGWEVGSPRHPRFSLAYNNGPHSGSTTHLALSDKWFWKRTHTASHPACNLCAQTDDCYYSVVLFWRQFFLAFCWDIYSVSYWPWSQRCLMCVWPIHETFDGLLVEPPVNKSTITLLQFGLGVQY